MKQPVEFSTDPSGILIMTFTGNLLDGDITAFRAALDMGSIVIKHQYEDKKQKLKTLLDMTHFSGKYTAEAVEVLAHFAKTNTPYIEKTASFGGSSEVRMAGETVSELAGRENIKVFETKEEALAWLG